MQKDGVSEKSIQVLSSDQCAMASLIISNYNGQKFLTECLSSLMQLDYPLYEVIVVDAASTDKSVAIIERIFPKVRLIKKGKIGIGEAINYGIAAAKGEVIIFDLNNDDIVDKDWLSNLVKVLASSPDIGVVCGKRFKYGSSKLLDSAGGRIDFLTGLTPNYGQDKLDSAIFNVQREVDYVPVIATTKAVLKKVGLCDPGYYIYYEDSDFCLRVKRSGYKNVYLPSAVFWHRGSATVGTNSYFANYYLYRNQIRFVLKNYPLHFVVSSLFYCLILRNIYDLTKLVPPIGKTAAKLGPFFKNYTWNKDPLMLVKSRSTAVLWNIKNLKNTIAARYETVNKIAR